MIRFNYNRAPAWLAEPEAPVRIILLSQVVQRAPNRSALAHLKRAKRAVGRFAAYCLACTLAGALCGALAGILIVFAAGPMTALAGVPGPQARGSVVYPVATG